MFERQKPRPLSVAQLTQAIHLRLEEHFPDVWVAGEISNWTRASSGHVYFTLKDDKASIRCVMWRSSAFRLRFDPRNGSEVMLRGSISVYAVRGEYQLVALEMTPKGIGAAELALRQLKEKLLARGYFDPARKRPLPKFPRRIGLIASPTGAAIRDMLEILANRWPLAEVVVCPSRVQGEQAPFELSNTLRRLDQLHRHGRLELDAVVLGRGGGSNEDLSAFNEEIVAEAIFQSTIPVVSAVGHEIDVTIADMVADYRALTPSQAITALTPDQEQLMEGLLGLAARMTEGMQYRIDNHRQRLDKLAERPALARPMQRVREREQKLDELGLRLHRAARRFVQAGHERLAHTAEQLEGLSPLNVLRRGYSLTRKEGDEQLLRKADEIRVGDRLETRLASGTIVSRVEEVGPTQNPGE